MKMSFWQGFRSVTYSPLELRLTAIITKQMEKKQTRTAETGAHNALKARTALSMKTASQEYAQMKKYAYLQLLQTFWTRHNPLRKDSCARSRMSLMHLQSAAA